MNLSAFIHEIRWEDLPPTVRSRSQRCLLDTLGAALGGRSTQLSQIIHDFAAETYPGKGAYLWLDGRQVSPLGAALANGMTTDSLDIHDGYVLVKGHAGAALVPAALASLALERRGAVTGQELLVSLVVGYEVALRAGTVLHATAQDYHSSGSWNALGCAAITARRMGLDAEATRQALGIAEYHGPRSQMLRYVEYPTMLKDGSGWGAMVGVSAALLASRGFTGAPAITVEAEDASGIWEDLGVNWLITRQYFKPHAVCRWAQPAIDGAIALQQSGSFRLEEIVHIRVETFHEATLLDCRRPQNTEEAQYSLPYPVAAALAFGQLGPLELSGSALENPLVLDLAERVELVEDPELDALFPARRFARVQIETVSGETFDSGEVQAGWEAESPPSDQELREKFRWLAHTQLSEGRTASLEEAIWDCAESPDAGSLVAMLAPPAEVGLRA